jgi:hypothetical protein
LPKSQDTADATGALQKTCSNLHNNSLNRSYFLKVSVAAFVSWFLLDQYGGSPTDENGPETSKNWKWLRWVVLMYNALGLFDFVGAFATGVPSLPAFEVDLVTKGVSTRYLDFFWMIPSYNVPLFGCIHIFSVYKLIKTW